MKRKPRRQYHTTITLEGWYFLGIMGFILAGALLRQMNLLILLFGLMIGPMYVNWRIVAHSLRKIRVSRSAPSSIVAGEKLVVDIKATNEGKRTSWAVRVDDKLTSLSFNGVALRPGVLFSRISPDETLTEAYEGIVPARGRYELGPLKVTTRFPLGLVRRTVVHMLKDEIIVFPRTGQLTPAWKERLQSTYHGSRPVKRQQGLMEGDFHALRDYRHGDSQRWIHWRTTARRGMPMVRQFERQRHHDLALLLDLWVPESYSSSDLESVELAVSFAATVVSDMCHRGQSQLLLGTAGATVDITRGPASRGLFTEAMEHLAAVSAGNSNHLGKLLTEAFDQLPPHCDIVLVSTRNVDLTDESLVDEMRQDSRKQGLFGKVLLIDASSSDILRYYQAL